MRLNITLFLSCAIAYCCAYIGNNYEVHQIEPIYKINQLPEQCVDTVRIYSNRNGSLRTTHANKGASKFEFILIKNK